MVRVRFAFNPSEALDVRNLRVALLNFLFVKKEGGGFVLRVDNLDKNKEILASEEECIQVFRELGISFDESPSVGGQFAPYTQLERLDIYQNQLQELVNRGVAYFCFCSHEELEEQRIRDLRVGKPPLYNKKCRHLSSEERNHFLEEGRKPLIRLKTDLDVLKYTDLILGEKIFYGQPLGDLVLSKRDGSPLPFVASVIDDHFMKITHVIRSEDVLSHMPRELLLLKSFHYEVPHYVHLPLILNEDHQWFSKEHGALTLCELKEKGFLSEAVFHYLSSLGGGLGEGIEKIKIEEIPSKFSLTSLRRTSALFNWEELRDLNKRYLRQLSQESFEKKVGVYLSDFENFSQALELAWVSKNKAGTLKEIAELVRFILVDPEDFNQEAKQALEKSFAKKTLTALKEFLVDFSDPIDEVNYKTLMEKIKVVTKLKPQSFHLPIRAALTGNLLAAELQVLFSLLPKEKILKRVDHALENL